MRPPPKAHRGISFRLCHKSHLLANTSALLRSLRYEIRYEHPPNLNLISALSLVYLALTSRIDAESRDVALLGESVTCLRASGTRYGSSATRSLYGRQKLLKNDPAPSWLSPLLSPSLSRHFSCSLNNVSGEFSAPANLERNRANLAAIVSAGETNFISRIIAALRLGRRIITERQTRRNLDERARYVTSAAYRDTSIVIASDNRPDNNALPVRPFGNNGIIRDTGGLRLGPDMPSHSPTRITEFTGVHRYVIADTNYWITTGRCSPSSRADVSPDIFSPVEKGALRKLACCVSRLQFRTVRVPPPPPPGRGRGRQPVFP